MPVDVVCICVIVAKIILIDDPVRNAITIRIGAEERVIQIGSAIDDHRGKAGTIKTDKQWIGAKIIRVHQSGRLDRSERNVAPQLLAGSQRIDRYSARIDALYPV